MFSNLKNKKIHITTLGCKVNQYESDAMLEELERNGCVRADNDTPADIYIINTCSVTNMADRKSRQMINKMRRQNENAIIAATGCYIQASGNELKDRGIVDVIIGNNRKKDVARILSEYIENGSADDNFIDINKDCNYENMSVIIPENHTRAYMKIQDGCNNFCTYCIIPYVRGRIRSRKLSDIQKEAEVLASNGVKEIILTGINVSSYEDNEYRIKDVIQCVAATEGIKRIRLSSMEPRIITEDFLQAVSSLDSFCPHFHLSLQSACNKTLKAMNRHYTIEEYMSSVALIRKYFDNPAITTDVIVGFPGETDEDFEDTYRHLEALKLYEMHVFKYSRRKGTVADKMPDQIDEQIKTTRSNRLLELNKIQKEKFEDIFADKKQEVLIEEIITKDGIKYFRGHTTRYVLVDIPVNSLVSEGENPDEYINKIITA